MKEILGVVALLFSMMFFILGILVKITLGFRNEMRERMCTISNLFWEHEHTKTGRAYVPRDNGRDITNPKQAEFSKKPARIRQKKG